MVETNRITQSVIKGFIWLGGETHRNASPSIGPQAFLSHPKHTEMHTLSTHIHTDTHVICHCCTVSVSIVLFNVVSETFFPLLLLDQVSFEK